MKYWTNEETAKNILDDYLPKTKYLIQYILLKQQI